MEQNSKIKQRVKLVSYTKNPYTVLYLAFKECYSKLSSIERIETQDFPSTTQELKKVVKRLFSYGHESPLEHVSFTFAIDGISRACSHQLVRHRIASFSQKSQCYVQIKNFINEYIVPPKISKDKNITNDFQKAISIIFEIVDNFQNRHKDIPMEELRMLLPNATKTSLIVTMNIRELLHFFDVRCCKRAQHETRNVANRMLEKCKEVLPEIFETAGPTCKRLGYCPEHPKMSCKPELSIKQFTPDKLQDILKQYYEDQKSNNESSNKK